MTGARVLPLTGVVRDYAWGRVGGISAALGQEPGDGPEAELWLGAHSGAPAKVVDGSGQWDDLAQWQESNGEDLPYLMKLLAAASPLSLQAHPSTEQARAGYAREEERGPARDAPDRSYKDPHAKPEVVVAVEDGFDALCGFRPVEEVLALLDALGGQVDAQGLETWRSRLTGSADPATGVRDAVAWLLSGDPAVEELVRALGEADLTGPAGGEAELVRLLAGHHPGDAGIAVAFMLNRVTLRAGEALWLPAGNVHAYLSGLGVEVMDPSDNVLRGGLTGKHVDVPELLRVLDFTPGPPPRLVPVEVAAGVRAYRPSTQASGADVPWQLLEVTGPAEVGTGSPSIALVLGGEFTVAAGADDAEDATLTLGRGGTCFVDRPASLRIEGQGRLFLATTPP
ncbi:Mannose-6-phosphate isomerase [Serinicoccus hydrothermalis]|uniref:mannose-6-phosphate isomerase n=1 Tax=Serinicoccus hydrothermalis TaxID=1758689 RepID=A0A1B1N926_9MICO|nr:mannose-6-phosphate isomerase, class I [Serinicoccus hydrothermalis]ANS77911.1 Mannose-6-phosphate isomerase [Serinicoccus hydrothermalis]